METKDLTVELVTPAQARQWLADMRTNRAIKPRLVNRYARQMMRGNWHDNGETLKFDTNGRLCDGQHRLTAQVQANVDLYYCIARNVTEKGILDIDTGGNRTAGDVFQFNSIANPKNFAAAVHKYFYLQQHQIIVANPNPLTGQCDHSELLDLYNKYEGVWKDWLNFGQQCYKQYFVLSPALIAAYGFYLVHDMNHTKDEVRTFFTQLCYQKDVSLNAISLFFRRMMQERGMKRARVKMTAGYKQAIFIKTWNSYYTKKDLKQLSYNPDAEKGLWFV